jgi:hypothetical protein
MDPFILVVPSVFEDKNIVDPARLSIISRPFQSNFGCRDRFLKQNLFASFRRRQRLGTDLRRRVESVRGRRRVSRAEAGLRSERPADGLFRRQSQLLGIERSQMSRVGEIAHGLSARPVRQRQLPGQRQQHRLRRLRFRFLFFLFPAGIG